MSSSGDDDEGDGDHDGASRCTIMITISTSSCAEQLLATPSEPVQNLFRDLWAGA